MTQRFIPAVVAICATAIALPAIARPLPGVGPVIAVSKTIRFTDAELHTVKGAKGVAYRIQKAASDVCGRASVIGQQDADFIPCREETVDRALTTLNAPMVSAALGRATSLAQR